MDAVLGKKLKRIVLLSIHVLSMKAFRDFVYSKREVLAACGRLRKTWMNYLNNTVPDDVGKT